MNSKKIICERFDIEGVINREFLYHLLNNTGEYDYGDGVRYANVAEPTSIGIFEDNFAWRFLEFIKENFISDKLPNNLLLKIEDGSWHKIEKFDPENWLSICYEIRFPMFGLIV